MNSYDLTVPQGLKEIQHWFGGIISGPMDVNSQIHPCTPSGNSIQEEAKKYIVPSPTLEPWERMQIYNQQYWWRLLKTMQETYPLLLRLFDYYDFNQSIAIPYLMKYPPNSWSLNPLGSRLSQWIEKEYDESDRELVLHSALIDAAYNDHFMIAELPPLSSRDFTFQSDNHILLKTALKLQFHVSLFHLPYDLFSFRSQMLKEKPEYWVEHDFPELCHEDFYFVHYRTLYNDLHWEQIGKAEHYLLSLFKEGTTIEDACTKLEEQDTEIRSEAAKQLSDWFQTWAVRHWLTKY